MENKCFFLLHACLNRRIRNRNCDVHECIYKTFFIFWRERGKFEWKYSFLPCLFVILWKHCTYDFFLLIFLDSLCCCFIPFIFLLVWCIIYTWFVFEWALHFFPPSDFKTFSESAANSLLFCNSLRSLWHYSSFFPATFCFSQRHSCSEKGWEKRKRKRLLVRVIEMLDTLTLTALSPLYSRVDNDG